MRTTKKEGSEMAESTKVIRGLKRAANYSKLGMHELGPRSFKKGQGALLKVLYKFSDDGALCKKKLEKVLGWHGKELRRVAKKAANNGYVIISDPQYKFEVSLTDKGKEVVEKRLAAEDRAADAILEGLSAEERDQLLSITEKIEKTCEELGIDYSVIKEHKHHCKKHGGHGHGHGCKGGHDHGGCDMGGGHGHGHGKKGCCHHDDAPQYVFVFGEGHHHC